MKKNNERKRGAPITHGFAGTRPYKIWQGMKARCRKKTHVYYSRYGGRGIDYVSRWEKFENFWFDMKTGYSDKLTLDRKNNNKGYFKKNCRWATKFEQMNNANYNKRITLKGKTQTYAQWARELGISKSAFGQRVSKSFSQKELTMRTGGKSAVYLTFKGLTKRATDWAKEVGITKYTLSNRLHDGWSVKKALTQPVRKMKNNTKLV